MLFFTTLRRKCDFRLANGWRSSGRACLGDTPIRSHMGEFFC